MSISRCAVAETAVAEDPRASKSVGAAPPKRRIMAHGDAELTPEPR